jgi:FkbM family methyltransferase
VSYEPLPEAFKQLNLHASRDDLWECHRVAIGESDGDTTLNISANSVSSSILCTKDELVDIEPDAKHVQSVKVRLRSLDSMLIDSLTHNDRLLVKIDVQGYEHQVIQGAAEVLRNAVLIETELSLIPLYEGQRLYREVIDELERRGFTLVLLEHAFANSKTGQLLQVDGLFARV